MMQKRRSSVRPPIAKAITSDDPLEQCFEQLFSDAVTKINLAEKRLESLFLGAVSPANPLENYLEKLFSDAILPELTNAFEQLPQPAIEAMLPSALSTVIGLPRPVSKRRILKPKWLTRPNWVTVSLSTVAVSSVLAVILIEQGILTRPFKATSSSNTRSAAIARWAAPAATSEAPFAAPSESTATLPSPAPESTSELIAISNTQHPTAAKEAEPTPSLNPGPAPVAGGGAEPTLALEPDSTMVADAGETESLAFSAPASSAVSIGASEPTPTLEPSPTLEIIAEQAELAPTLTSEPTATIPEPTPSIPTRLVIPAIDLEAPITAVGIEEVTVDGQLATSWTVPQYFAAGWHDTSAPAGQVGNTVLNGHQLINGGVFENLAALQRNDEIILHAGDSVRNYRVSEVHLLAEEGQPLSVRAENAQWIMPTADERLTLVTCWPEAKSSHRLIVVALPVEPPSNRAPR